MFKRFNIGTRSVQDVIGTSLTASNALIAMVLEHRFKMAKMFLTYLYLSIKNHQNFLYLNIKKLIEKIKDILNF